MKISNIQQLHVPHGLHSGQRITFQSMPVLTNPSTSSAEVYKVVLRTQSIQLARQFASHLYQPRSASLTLAGRRSQSALWKRKEELASISRSRIAGDQQRP